MNWEEVKKKGSSHYKGGVVEPIDLIRNAGLLRGFALGNIIKYAYRNSVDGEPISLSDLEKIIHYAEMLMVSYGE